MLKILGRQSSSNVQKVLWCCTELNITFERQDFGGEFGRTRETSYLDLNPNATVPTVIDGDLVLWESNSILRYLANKYGDDSIYPQSAGQRALGERWMDWQLSVLFGATFDMFWQLVRTSPEDRNEELIAASRDKSSEALAILDSCLAKTEFVAGSNFSICDIPVGVFAHRWFGLDIKREHYVHLERWYSQLSERPGYQAYVKVPLV